MKKLIFSGATGLLLSLAATSSFGAGADPIWLFTDNGKTLFQYFRYCDTARTKDVVCYALESDQFVDTGSAYDKFYINLDYQFSNDTFKVYNEFDPNQVDYKDYRPGFAGFKTAWDYGMTGYAYGRYKYLVFAHKGPNLKHKVTVKAWYNNGECGAPSYSEMIGSFNASSDWKVDSIAIPAAITNQPDIIRNGSVYFELVFIINNIDPTDKSPSEKSNFKIDDIRISGRNPIDASPKSAKFLPGESTVLKVTTSKVKSDDVLTYQWKKDGVEIPQATKETYSASQAGKYTVDVKVASTGYTYTSDPADVTEGKGGLCGGGALLAFLPVICLRAFSSRKKKKQ